MKFLAKDKINKFKNELTNLIKNYDNNENLCWEEKRILAQLEGLEKKLEIIEDDIDCYCKDTLEGQLYLNESKRFAINDKFGNEIYFNCGSYIEMYLFDEFEEKYMWHPGIVDSTCIESKPGNIYYFRNKTGKNKNLEENDLVRIRINKRV